MSHIYGLQAVQPKVPTKDKAATKTAPTKATNTSRKATDPTADTGSKKPPVLAVLGASAGLLGVLYASGREELAEKLIMPVVIGNAAYAAYVILPDFFGAGGGGGGNPANEAAAQQAAGAEVRANEAAAQQAAGARLSWPESHYYTMADTIYNSLRYSGIQDDKPKAKGLLYYMYNDVDVAKLSAAYGTRQHYLSGIPDGPPKNLFTIIREEFPVSYITEINSLWAGRGIKARI